MYSYESGLFIIVNFRQFVGIFPSLSILALVTLPVIVSNQMALLLLQTSFQRESLYPVGLRGHNRCKYHGTLSRVMWFFIDKG